MKALESALQVLKLFATEETLSVGEIAERTGLQRSNLSKVLADFRNNGFLDQDPVTRRYRVGLAAFELGAFYGKTHPLARDALPFMRELVERCGHTTALSVRSGDTFLHLMAVEGPLYVEGHWRVGNRLAYHATSAGKVLLAGMADDKIDGLLKRQPPWPVTSDTVTDPGKLKAQVAEIRRTGVAVSRGESARGLAAAAVPVFDRTDRTAAAIGLIVPDHLFETTRTGELAVLLHDAARRLSVKLGASVYPYGDADAAADGGGGLRAAPRNHLEAKA
jgi:IclR family acetate operon transcriptional repressor